MRENTQDAADCADHLPSGDRSGLEVFVGNLPYIAMILLGAAVIALGRGRAGWIAAALYAAYGVVGALWIILFVCPCCPLYGTRKCPCGYGAIAAHLRRAGDRALFMRRFRRHIPVIIPLWFIPLVVGGLSLWRLFAWPRLALLAIFAVEAFILLPLVARKHACAQCPQREDCPWMRRSKQATPPSPDSG